MKKHSATKFGYPVGDLMKVYGYTEENVLVGVDLTVDQIVAAGIDPFRVDLCDPDPVIWTDGDVSLRFRRLQDFSFAYLVDDEIFVGLHDGTVGTCVRGAHRFSNRSVTRCENIVASNRSFAEHWAEYLRQKGKGRLLYPSCSITSPVSAAAVELAGNQLRLNLDDNLFSGWPNHPTFVGTMLDRVTCPIAMPSQVNAAFEIFAQWNPVVHDQTVWDILTGKEPADIRIAIEEGCLERMGDELAKYAQPMDRWVQTKLFRIEGVEYWVKEQYQGKPVPWPNHTLPDVYFTSLDHLYAPSANKVSGLRISWLDIAMKQARPMIERMLSNIDPMFERFEQLGMPLVTFKPR